MVRKKSKKRNDLTSNVFGLAETAIGAEVGLAAINAVSGSIKY